MREIPWALCVACAKGFRPPTHAKRRLCSPECALSVINKKQACVPECKPEDERFRPFQYSDGKRGTQRYCDKCLKTKIVKTPGKLQKKGHG